MEKGKISIIQPFERKCALGKAYVKNGKKFHDLLITIPRLYVQSGFIKPGTTYRVYLEEVDTGKNENEDK